MNNAYDITISSLRIRGPEELQHRLGRELQSLNWPQATGDEYVFVRSVKAQAEAERLPGMMIEQAQRSIRYEQNPDKVMRFASRTAMLAALLADLARGVAGQRWYWKRWSRLLSLPTGKAIASVMADEQHSLNALVEVLHARQQAVHVWKALGDDDAAGLIREISWKNGYPLPETGAPLADSQGLAGLILPRLVQQRWLPMLETLHSRSPRFTLAALLIAQQCMPLRLSRSGSSTVAAVTLFLQQALGAAQVFRPAIQPASLPRSGPWPPGDTRPLNSHSGNAGQPPVALPENQLRATPVKRIIPTLPPRLQEQPEGGKRRAEKEEGNPKPVQHCATGPQSTDRMNTSCAPATRPMRNPVLTRTHVRIEPAPRPLLSACQTTQGGTLYLLNFLNRLPVRSIMETHWQSLPSGWMWVYRLATLLQLDESDSITTFLAAQLGMEEASHLQLLPPLPQEEQIKRHAWQWYGSAGLWQPELLNLPARICWNASHTDMYIDASRVDINLRLAGLDLNPGWLPWLGQVVQFHFVENAASEGSPHE